MIIKLLWLETLMKLASGVLLLVIPLTTTRVLGLQQPGEPFWPRLLGGVLTGLAAATFLEGFVKNTHGLGLAGAMAINLAGAATLATQLVVGKPAPTWRGRALLWLTTATLATLAFVELANV